MPYILGSKPQFNIKTALLKPQSYSARNIYLSDILSIINMHINLKMNLVVSTGINQRFKCQLLTSFVYSLDAMGIKGTIHPMRGNRNFLQTFSKCSMSVLKRFWKTNISASVYQNNQVMLKHLVFIVKSFLEKNPNHLTDSQHCCSKWSLDPGALASHRIWVPPSPCHILNKHLHFDKIHS